MMQTKILLVDDDMPLVQGLQRSLLNAGYEAYTAHNGVDGLQAAQLHAPDVVVLDVNMPWMDGLELCRRLRSDSLTQDVPILFLTSRDEVDEKLAGFDAGADDYLCKPFNSRELQARLKALVKRQQRSAFRQQRRLSVGPIVLDVETGVVTVGARATQQLTPTEAQLLRLLMCTPNRTFSSVELLEQAWGYDYGTADSSLARFHVRNLRNKLEEDPRQPQFLQTVPRRGYQLVVNSVYA